MQPVPKLTDADVERIVRRDFPSDKVAEVFTVLEAYGTEPWHREPARVRIAACKLAAGNLDRLQQEIARAKEDYRDTLAAAEYPRYCRCVPGPEMVSEEDEKRVIDADWKQYQEWFNS
jgi:hypothetical protein